MNLKEVEKGEVMRIRVRIDVTLPLCRGRVFLQKDGSKGWVSFKYKRLPNVCYWCGCLNHFDKDCERWIQNNGTLRKEDQEYGPWLCASPLPMHKNSVIVVPGYYETKRKGFKAVGRKGVNRKKTEPRVPQIAARGGAHGGGGKEFQFQKNTPNEGDVMNVTEVNANKTSLEGHLIRGGIAIQGEYFAEKINEIDKELKKFDLEKGNQEGYVTEEAHKISECLVNEEAAEYGIPQNLMDSCELLSETTHHVPQLSENP